MSTGKSQNPWLFGYAVFSAVATLVLICLGGLVTSKGVGMAVPDWPTSFGYNMFWLPLDKWWGNGGIHDEHLHRLWASSVGFLTILLAIWVQLSDKRPAVRKLAWFALVLVIAQGLLGGLRVVLDQRHFLSSTLGVWFGIGHATLGQLYFSSMALIAFLLSPAWARWTSQEFRGDVAGVRAFLPYVVGLIVLQLVIAATMRHQHSGLAIPDFPLAYGKLWPDTDPESVLRYNQRRIDPMNEREIHAFHIHLQMAHRMVAVVIVTAVGWVALKLSKVGGLLGRMGVVWGGLLVTQFFLGAATIWTNKSADIATAHVAVGAISLMTGILLTVATRVRCDLRFSEVNPCSKAEDFLKPRPAQSAAGSGVR